MAPRYGRFRKAGFPAWSVCGLLLATLAACARSGDPSTDDTPAGGAPAFSFTDVSEQAGIAGFRHVTGAFGKRWFPESMGSGGGFVDYDGDGWEDLLLVGGGNWPEHSGRPEPKVDALRLYRNNGNGTFTDVTAKVGLGGIRAYSFGVATADYDNDGDQDIYLTTLGDNLLFRNDGGTFAEVGQPAGVGGGGRWSTSAMFFDADRDGHVDLLVGNYVDWSVDSDLVCVLEGGIRSYCTPELYQGTPPNFFHNNGDGTFSDWTERAGFVPAPGKTLGLAEYDMNRDGWSDVFIADDTERNLFLVNNGDGTFTERGQLAGMAYDENGKARAGMGIDVGVVDESGHATLFVGNFSKEMMSVYRYGDDGLFTDRAALSQIGRTSLLTLTFGLFLFDVDLDGDLDLFAANGHVQPEIEQTQEGVKYAEPPHLFINDGNGLFQDVAASLSEALQQTMVGRGTAYADYDRDGDLDVLITENAGAAYLFRNDLRASSAVRVHLTGTRSNRDGLSSRIVAYVGGHARERFIRTGSSFLSVSEKEATFGLGSAPQIDSLVVYWPSGQVDRHPGLKPGFEVRVTEGAPAPELIPLGKPAAVAVRDPNNR